MTLTSYPWKPLLGLCTVLACGGDGGTSATNSGTNLTLPITSTDDPGTTPGESSSGEPTTAGSASDSATGTSTGSTGSTGDPTSTSTTAVSGTSSSGDPSSSGTTALDTSSGDTSTGPGDTGAGPGDTSTGGSSSDDTSTGEPGTTDPIDSCAEWQPLFDAEVQEIRGCTEDVQCGQELLGTSCGCTRNWVALKDADISEFMALVDKANELGCELPFFSTCDCPATDGFACVGGICTWNYT